METVKPCFNERVSAPFPCCGEVSDCFTPDTQAPVPVHNFNDGEFSIWNPSPAQRKKKRSQRVFDSPWHWDVNRRVKRIAPAVMIFDFFPIISDGSSILWKITDNPITQRNIGSELQRKTPAGLPGPRTPVSWFGFGAWEQTVTQVSLWKLLEKADTRQGLAWVVVAWFGWGEGFTLWEGI